MSKELKPNEWIEYAKYKKFLYHNKDMNTLISISYKTPKKVIKLLELKNTQDKHEIWKENLQEIGYDELSDLISELVDNGDEKLTDNKHGHWNYAKSNYLMKGILFINV